jgi:DNA-binding response OmpR family regulator
MLGPPHLFEVSAVVAGSGVGSAPHLTRGEVSPASPHGDVTDSTTLLLVEDDLGLRTFLADNLTADGFDVLLADTVHDAVRLLEYKQPDLALVDLGLPDGSGLDLIRRVRAADGIASRLDPGLPLVILTGRSSELDRVRGFDRGADDFVCKPFSYAELRGRMTAILRRTKPRAALGRLRVGDLEIDPPSREVRLRGRRVELSQKEFALLKALASSPTRVFTKEELLRDVWGFRSMGTTRTLDSHACRLRQKLGTGGDRFVVNVWGVGYRLVDGPVEAVAA